MIAEYTNVTIIPVIATQDIVDEGTGGYVNGSWTGFLKEIINGNVDTATEYYQFTRQRSTNFTYSYPVYNVNNLTTHHDLTNIFS